MNKKQITVVAIALVAAALFGIGAGLYQQRVNDQQALTANNNLALITRADAPTFGPTTAKVSIVEFFDPACETCRAFYPMVKSFVKDNPGRVKAVIRYAPLHAGSDQVVKALEAARLQNLYWSALEALLERQHLWASHSNPDIGQIWPLMQAVGVDIEQAKKDMINPEIDKMLQRDLRDLATLNVTKTPTFFVNGKPLPTFGYEPLRKLVEQEIGLQYGQP
ncbi:MAG: DsbA family protein [Polaromonas sp.]|nr:DsbA family protein [Polaromonas sp.]